MSGQWIVGAGPFPFALTETASARQEMILGQQINENGAVANFGRWQVQPLRVTRSKAIAAATVVAIGAEASVVPPPTIPSADVKYEAQPGQVRLRFKFRSPENQGPELQPITAQWTQDVPVDVRHRKFLSKLREGWAPQPYATQVAGFQWWGELPPARILKQSDRKRSVTETDTLRQQPLVPKVWWDQQQPRKVLWRLKPGISSDSWITLLYVHVTPDEKARLQISLAKAVDGVEVHKLVTSEVSRAVQVASSVGEIST